MKKSVTFNEDKNKIHLLIVLDYASRQARINTQLADKFHFKRRINKCEEKISYILDSNYRNVVYNQRYNVENTSVE